MSEWKCNLCEILIEAPHEVMEQRIAEHWPLCPCTAPGAQEALENTRRVFKIAEDLEQQRKAREGN